MGVGPKLAPILPLLLPVKQMSPTCVRMELEGRLIGRGVKPILINNTVYLRTNLEYERQKAGAENLGQQAMVAASLPGKRRGRKQA